MIEFHTQASLHILTAVAKWGRSPRLSQRVVINRPASEQWYLFDNPVSTTFQIHSIKSVLNARVKISNVREY